METKYLNFHKISDPRGNLTFIQFPEQIPFDIKRVFWTYNVPAGEIRGGHAYKTQHEVIIAISGSFDVVTKDRNGQLQRIHLNRGYEGLLLPPNTWRHLENFSTNSVSLHISSSVYDDSDYLMNFVEFSTLER
ncbi:MAG: TDP-4-oxo-6-deoxy-alpha-D-glucose-3,4-oxoisomerase [Bacteroidota bacterium]|jgi:dTDP-4-dehydrorhamnose 3,5-epimerase-like enzyme